MENSNSKLVNLDALDKIAKELRRKALADISQQEEEIEEVRDMFGGKSFRYVLQEEYDNLSEEEKNNPDIVWIIIDAEEKVIPTDLTINSNNLLQLKDANGNAIGTGVTVSTTSGGSNSYTLPIASNTVLGGIKVGSNLSIDSNGVLSATVTGTGSGMTDDEVDTVLTNVFGESYLPQVYGNIIVSVNQLSINEGQNGTFTVSLSQVPTRPQTITIISNNPDVTVNPSSIDISDTNAHTITVIAAEDDDFDNDSAILTLSSPNVPNVTVNVTVIDNDVQDEPPMGTNIVNVEASQWAEDGKNAIRTILPIKVTPKATYTISKRDDVWVIVYASTADGAFGNTIVNNNTSSFTFVPATDYVIIGMLNLVSDSWDGDIKNAPSMCGLTVIKTTESK